MSCQVRLVPVATVVVKTTLNSLPTIRNVLVLMTFRYLCSSLLEKLALFDTMIENEDK